MNQGKEALAWMRKQAREIDPFLEENESVYFCAKTISCRLESLEDTIKNNTIISLGARVEKLERSEKRMACLVAVLAEELQIPKEEFFGKADEKYQEFMENRGKDEC